jgi:hypothetical protein
MRDIVRTYRNSRLHPTGREGNILGETECLLLRYMTTRVLVLGYKINMPYPHFRKPFQSSISSMFDYMTYFRRLEHAHSPHSLTHSNSCELFVLVNTNALPLHNFLTRSRNTTSQIPQHHGLSHPKHHKLCRGNNLGDHTDADSLYIYTTPS